MIRYALKCHEGHGFDSWFQSAAAFDRLRDAGHVACSVCGSGKVEKDLMAPSVGSGRAAAAAPETAGRPLSRPASAAEAALAELRRKLESQSDYVGPRFADEARRMHVGDAPQRSIWGEAKPDEAKRLIEDGVPVAPLPFLPKRQAN